MGHTKLRERDRRAHEGQQNDKRVTPSSSSTQRFNLPSQSGQIHHPCIAHREYRTPPPQSRILPPFK